MYVYKQRFSQSNQSNLIYFFQITIPVMTSRLFISSLQTSERLSPQNDVFLQHLLFLCNHTCRCTVHRITMCRCTMKRFTFLGGDVYLYKFLVLMIFFFPVSFGHLIIYQCLKAKLNIHFIVKINPKTFAIGAIFKCELMSINKYSPDFLHSQCKL